MKLPLLSSKELCRFIEKQGFGFARQKGSHRIYKHPDGRKTVVPMHNRKDIKRSLLKLILNEIRMTRSEFFDKYK